MPLAKSPDKKEPHPLLRLVDPLRVPGHVAIIMDGNGRWAKSRGLPRIEGHKAGIEAVREAIAAAGNLGVKFLTLYAFSMENWKRPAAEVKALFSLLERFLASESHEILERDIRFRTLGRVQDLPSRTLRMLRGLEDKTRNARSRTLTLALSYGGRTEIADACDALVREALRQGRASPVSVEDVARHLYSPDLPDPDLLIRTSGEYRVSNFLLWQIAYTEMAILDLYWPDFKEQHFYEAVLDFQRRDRRYGGVHSGPGEAPAREDKKGLGP